MAITQTPGTTYSEVDTDPQANGTGAEIPIFIGISGNNNPTPGVQKFKKYEDVRKTVSEHGIGTDVSTNPLLAALKDFFEEAKKVNSDDIGIPYVYVIDLGARGSEATISSAPWVNAMKLAKTVQNATMEIYVGFKSTDTAADYLGIMASANQKIEEYVKMCQPRIAYFTVEGATDTELKELTKNSNSNYIQNSRVALIEPGPFGKILARIATTRYSEEPGHYKFRSVKAGEFTERSKEEELELQNSGILFGRDEKAGADIYPKICLGTSTAFAEDPDSRPKDALLHARRNVDQLIRDAYVTLYPQLKRNETEGYLSYSQADVDTLISNKKDAGEMKEGTYLDVAESDIDPYDLKITGEAVPINATYSIGINMYLGDV